MDGVLAEIEIRKATEADLDAAYGIVAEYYEAACVVQRETRLEFAREYLSTGAGAWLALAQRQIVGCIALRRLSEPASAEIKRLFVRQTWRGRGVAQLLLDAAEQFARSQGYRWIYLDTTDEMVAAAKFYARNGYQTSPRYNNNPQATIFMRKQLHVQA